jgi:hypothetical protein
LATGKDTGEDPLKIVRTITIPADTEAVWQTFLAVERWPEWSPWRLHFADQPRFEVAARFFVAVPAPWFRFITLKFPCQVTALENPNLICWSGKVLGVPGYHQFTLEDIPGGCRILSEEEFRGPFALFLWPVMRIIEGRAVEFLFRLRDAIVGNGHVSPDRPSGGGSA